MILPARAPELLVISACPDLLASAVGDAERKRVDRSPHLAVLRRLVPSTVAPRDTEAMLRHTLRSLTRLTGHELSSLGPGDIELAIARHVIGLHGGTLARRDAGGEAWHEVILELPTLLGAA